MQFHATPLPLYEPRNCLQWEPAEQSQYSDQATGCKTEGPQFDS